MLAFIYIILNVICIINDASTKIKTDTCKIPSYLNYDALIGHRYVIQALPIQYPSGNKDAYLYTIPVISVATSLDGNIPQVIGSSIWMTANGTLLLNDKRYEDFKNPIICKYWYFDM